MLNFCDFIQVYVFSTNHHLKVVAKLTYLAAIIGGHVTARLPSILIFKTKQIPYSQRH